MLKDLMKRSTPSQEVITVTEDDFSIVQPEGIRKLLNIKTDQEYDLVIKSWRFLFDFLYAMEDGTQVISNLVKFTKCGNLGILVSSDDKQLELEFTPEIDEDDLFEEIFGLIDETKIVKLPTI